MRFFVAALLSVLSVAATVSAVEYDDIDAEYETAGSRLQSSPQSSSPFMNAVTGLGSRLTSHHGGGRSSDFSGSEAALIMKSLGKFDRLGVQADRIVNYEVSPDMNFDNSRSLNIKMTPIMNAQKQNLVSLPTTAAGGNKIMMHLLSLGIKPSTVKKYLYLKRQGLTAAQSNPINAMLRIQRQHDLNTLENIESGERAFITSPMLSSAWNVQNQPITGLTTSTWNVNQPLTSAYVVNQPITGLAAVTSNPSTSFMNTEAVYGVGASSPNIEEAQHGVVIPSLAFANTLRESGVIVSTTTTGRPAIEIKHLQDSLLQCEKLEWRTSACMKLNQFATNVLGEQQGASTLHASIVGLTTPQVMSNIQLENIYATNAQ